MRSAAVGASPLGAAFRAGRRGRERCGPPSGPELLPVWEEARKGLLAVALSSAADSLSYRLTVLDEAGLVGQRVGGMVVYRLEGAAPGPCPP